MLQGFVLNLFAVLPFAVIAAAVVRMVTELEPAAENVSHAQISLLKKSPVMLGIGIVAAAIIGLAVAVVDGGVSAGAAITSLLA